MRQENNTLLGQTYTYTYDAWGNFTTTYHNGCTATSPANYNPFRYRGYYYDTELEMYYLQSRYYDPAIGRFINPDSVLAGSGNSVQGTNLYTYCFNNPVNLSDGSGNWPKWITDAVDWVNERINDGIEWVDKNIVQPASNFINNVVEDFKNYDSSNQSEQVVFDSNYFSNYKGAFVLKVSTDASFSYGFIGLSTIQQTSDTLNHEYGHTLQFDEMGIFSYTTNVAIPSVTINLLDRKNKLPYDYYSYPWEAEADLLGGVCNRVVINPLPDGGYTSYWDLIKLFFE